MGETITEIQDQDEIIRSMEQRLQADLELVIINGLSRCTHMRGLERELPANQPPEA